MGIASGALGNAKVYPIGRITTEGNAPADRLTYMLTRETLAAALPCLFLDILLGLGGSSYTGRRTRSAARNWPAEERTFPIVRMKADIRVSGSQRLCENLQTNYFFPRTGLCTVVGRTAEHLTSTCPYCRNELLNLCLIGELLYQGTEYLGHTQGSEAAADAHSASTPS
jgi:hypothetical protein